MDIQNYMNDDFLYQTDMEMLSNIDLEIPTIESIDDEDNDKANIHTEKDDGYIEDLSSNFSMQSEEIFSNEKCIQENKYIEEPLEEETSVITATENLTAADDPSTLSLGMNFELECE